MEIIRDTAPMDGARILRLWSQAFGEAEAALEAPQLDGGEAAENLDMVYAAIEDGELLGTIHATIPRADPSLCGLSGMCVAPAARGRGIGRTLFAEMLRELDGRGVTCAMLGTSNPVAAKLYASQGFAFQPGSNVMMRFTDGDAVDFIRQRYGAAPREAAILSCSAGMRIPMIPLAVFARGGLLLDCNAGICSTDVMTQTSCMGLYPKYGALACCGGKFYGAFGDAGAMGAMYSMTPTENGMRADFFCCGAYSACVPALLERCEADAGPVYFQLSGRDAEKREIVERMGFRPAEPAPYRLAELSLPTVLYRRA